MIGAVALAGLLSGNVGAEPPSVVAPVTGWQAVAIVDGPRPVETAKVDPTSIPGPLASPESTHRPRPEVHQIAQVKPVKVKMPPGGGSSLTGGHRIVGVASWYCRAGVSICMKGHPDGPGIDRYAAAGPALRAAICGVQSCLSWRGRTVFVNGQRVVLVDWCQCHWRTHIEKAIDLYYDVFALTGSSVTIRW